MTDYVVEVTLLSDTTFGRGDGVVGLVDTETEYDEESGLPFLHGHTLRGLLVEECANLLFSLQYIDEYLFSRVEEIAQVLFGQPGSRLTDTGCLRVDAATFPPVVQQAIRTAIRRKEIQPGEVLDALTAIRRQTAIADSTGTAERNSLRASRVVIRDAVLYASLHTSSSADSLLESAVLAACTRSIRRAGTGRNRGRGRISCRLLATMGGEEISVDPLWEGSPLS